MAVGKDIVAVFDRTVDELYRYASRLTAGDRMQAEDLVQDAYLALGAEVGRSGVPREPIAWLKRVVRNRFIDGVRRTAREDRRVRRLVPQESVEPVLPEDTSFLATLPEDQRVAMVLRYVDDLSVADVASALGRTVAATESLLARARAAARARIEGASS